MRRDWISDGVLFESAEVRLRQREGRVAVLEFLHPRPRIEPGILEGLYRPFDVAEADSVALVVHAPRGHFSYGADLDYGFVAAERGNLCMLDAAIIRFQ